MSSRARVTCSCGRVFKNEHVLLYHQSASDHPAFAQTLDESRAEEVYRAAAEALRAKREEQMAEESFDERDYFESTSGVDPSSWPDPEPSAATLSVEFAVEASYQRAAHLIRGEHERKRLQANRDAWALTFRQTERLSWLRTAHLIVDKALSELILLILLFGLGLSGAGVGALVADAMETPGQLRTVAGTRVQPLSQSLPMRGQSRQGSLDHA